MTDERIRLIIEAEDKAGAALQSVQRELRGVDRTAKKGKTGLTGAKEALMDVAAEATAAAGILASFAVATKKAFDMGEEGANLILLRQSFDRLMYSVEASPEVLEEMRAAVRDTVAETELMASANTLLAGTQGKLSEELARSLPELAAIADAAHRLNPTLGSTTFLMESIAAGVKRGSKQLLDNLGIIVDMNQAYAEYAHEIGKSADALTEEEQKIALLHATIKQGHTIMAQAGQDGAELTDSYQQARVAMQETAEEIKRELAPVMGDLAKGVYWVLTYHKKLNEVLDEHRREVTHTAASYEDYVHELMRSYVVAGKMGAENARLMEQQILLGKANHQVYESWKILDREMWETYQRADEATDSFQRMTVEQANAALAADRLRQAQVDLKSAVSDLDLEIRGPLGQEIEDWQEKQDDLNRRLQETGEAIAELMRKKEGNGGWLSASDAAQLDGLREKYGDIKQAIEDTAQAHDEATKRILFDLLEQRLAVDGLSQAEFDFLVGIANQWGLVDDATAQAVEGIDESMDLLAQGNVNAALEKMEELRREAEGLPKKIDIHVNITQSGSLPNTSGSGSSSTYYYPEMSGGMLTPGAAYMIAEGGRPEVVVPTGPAVVRQVQFDNNFNIQAQTVDGASIRREMAWMEWTAYHGY